MKYHFDDDDHTNYGQRKIIFTEVPAHKKKKYSQIPSVELSCIPNIYQKIHHGITLKMCIDLTVLECENHGEMPVNA